MDGQETDSDADWTSVLLSLGELCYSVILGYAKLGSLVLSCGDCGMYLDFVRVCSLCIPEITIKEHHVIPACIFLTICDSGRRFGI